MSSITEYYKRDHSHLLRVFEEVPAQSHEYAFKVTTAVHLDFEANAKFASLYIPPCPALFEVCLRILGQLQNRLKRLDAACEVEYGFAGQQRIPSGGLAFTGRVFIYCNDELKDGERAALESRAKELGFVLYLRTPAYATERAGLESPLAFVSHDSRNKDEVARPLAQELSRLGCPVWYDEYSLKVGDSLRESIERGLRECKRCVLVLSPEFLANPGWTRVEFDSVFTRELMSNDRVFLPVWVRVNKHQVYEFCPSLADRVALDWTTLGCSAVAAKLRAAVNK